MKKSQNVMNVLKDILTWKNLKYVLDALILALINANKLQLIHIVGNARTLLKDRLPQTDPNVMHALQIVWPVVIEQQKN